MYNCTGIGIALRPQGCTFLHINRLNFYVKEINLGVSGRREKGSSLNLPQAKGK